MTNFSEFLSKTIEENNIDYLKNFPSVLLDSQEKLVTDYMIDYYDKHGSVPLKKIIEKDIDNAKYLISSNVPNGKIEQVYSEARRKNRDKRVRDLLNDSLAVRELDFDAFSKKFGILGGSIHDRSLDTIEDDSTFELPESRVEFKYKSLEHGVNSLLAGELCVIAGRLKTKKTWITLDLALDASIRQNKKVYFTSLEMNNVQIKQRIQALIGGFNPNVFRVGSQSDLNQAKSSYNIANRKIKEKSTGQFILPKNMTQTIYDVIRDVEAHKPDVVFVDSIYLFKDDRGRPISDNWGQLSVMISMLKNLARENNIQVICNTQLKRGSGQDVGVDDIAYSDSFAQTADIVLGLTKNDENGVEKVAIQPIASRFSPSNTLCWVEFDWNNCRIEEYKPNIIKKLQLGN